MYLSSTGGLTCGRRNPDHALFPYETDDRIHDASATAGPFTLLRLHRDGRSWLWEPFRNDAPVYRLERNLYKNRVANRLVFEEINRDLGVAFEYEWACGDRYGFIRRATLRNLESTALRVDVMDGLRNVLPAGVGRTMQSNRSTLIDAYRQAHVDEETGAGIFTLSSIPSDRAEPSEALKATAVWQSGLTDPCVLLSSDQAGNFRSGGTPQPETERYGRRTDYLVCAQVDLPADGERRWTIAGDVNLGAPRVVELLREVNAGIDPDAVEADVARGTARLGQLVGAADGYQHSGDALKSARHFSNALFNVMRGGVFHDGNRVPVGDFLRFARSWNRTAGQRLDELLGDVGATMTRGELLAAVSQENAPDLERLALEYLPLTFSRRHGDPSRPWNHFDIVLKDKDGNDLLTYAGNWRDIFQNWEALAHSYPSYIESFVARFVNASTADGYNPYRITRDGIDWEVLEPDDPWSNIGYWGDHQVNYLLKLLELSRDFHPGALSAFLDRDRFVFADVPYRIRGYDEILADPYNTVDYDEPHAERIAVRVAETGADGRLVTREDGSLHRVNLLEKLLVVALVRLGNLVPGGGIWMNTQRPEWNDANNALVGYGLSMVTLCYLRRYLQFLDDLLSGEPTPEFPVSGELHEFFDAIEAVFATCPPAGTGGFSDRERKRFVDAAGAAGQAYRERVYAGFSGDRSGLETDRIRALLQAALTMLDDSINENRRGDGLYHAYNLLAPADDGFGVERLQEMLEGQVAVLASGQLGPRESLELLDALRASALYRPDQASYTLYPHVRLPGFLEKNRIDAATVTGDAWISGELDAGRTDFFERDADGQVRFNGRFRNAAELRRALAVERDVDEETLDRLGGLFERVFDHRRFTGRSGTMYKYEGLGCIYWHMVSKLLLEVGDLLERHHDAPADVLDGLRTHYRRIEDGLGVHKSPVDYGAFTTDPYSHTPAFAGVQQPGMTGQVKEDIISRLGELGVRVDGGCVRFEPTHLARAEFIARPDTFEFSTGGEVQRESLPAEALAFCLCGVPVIYRTAAAAQIRLHTDGEGVVTLDGSRLDAEWSRTLFEREGRLKRIEVDVLESALR